MKEFLRKYKKNIFIAFLVLFLIGLFFVFNFLNLYFFQKGICYHYFKYGNNVYLDFSKIRGADAKTFKCVDWSFTKDKNNVYCKGNKIGKNLKKSSSGSYYFVDDKDVFYIYDCNKIENVDFDSFEEIISDKQDPYFSNFAKDKNNIYFENKKINNIDYNSFRIINYLYSKDNKNIYCGERLTSFDVSSFILLRKNYVKDKKGIYYTESEDCNELLMNDVDEDSFEVLDLGYAKDKNYLYFKGLTMKADLNTIKFYGGNLYYAKDKSNIFFEGKVLDNFDYDTFKVCSGNNIGDKNSCYFHIGGELIKKVDSSECDCDNVFGDVIKNNEISK